MAANWVVRRAYQATKAWNNKTTSRTMTARLRRASGAKRPGIRKSGRLLQKFVGCTGADCPPPGCLLAQGDATGAVGNDVTRCPRVDTGRLNWREIVR